MQRVNNQFCSIVGYTRGELQSLSFADITHPDDLRLDEEQIGRVIADEIDAFELEKRYLHKQGNVVWVRLYSNVAREPSGAIKYARDLGWNWWKNLAS